MKDEDNLSSSVVFDFSHYGDENSDELIGFRVMRLKFSRGQNPGVSDQFQPVCGFL